MFRSAYVRPYLTPAGLLDVGDLNSLRAIGVRDADALFGLIQSNPEPVARLLEGTSLAELQADAFWHTSATFRALRAEVRERIAWPAIGECPPQGVRRRAPALVDRYLHSVNVAELDTAPTVDLRSRFPADPRIDRGTIGPADRDSHGVEHLVCNASSDDDASEPWLYFSFKLVNGIPLSEETFVGTASDGPDAIGIVRTSNRPNPSNTTAAPASEFARLPRRSVNAVKQTLAGGVPVLIALPVFPSWRKNLHVELTGEVVLPLPREELEGGHAVCLVGYGDDANYPGGGAFIFRNSWGSNWARNSVVGEAGCGVLPYAYAHELAWDAWAWSRSGHATPPLPVQGGGPSRWWRRRITGRPAADR